MRITRSFTSSKPLRISSEATDLPAKNGFIHKNENCRTKSVRSTTSENTHTCAQDKAKNNYQRFPNASPRTMCIFNSSVHKSNCDEAEMLGGSQISKQILAWHRTAYLAFRSFFKLFYCVKSTVTNSVIAIHVLPFREIRTQHWR